MKITRIETFQIETPRYYGHVSGHVIVKVHVDAGPVGLGEASDSRAADLGAIARRYNALIDTGALITGYSNREVASELLRRGLAGCAGSPGAPGNPTRLATRIPYPGSRIRDPGYNVINI